MIVIRMLFNDIIFGPVQSRRLGVSLGINLLPKQGKICSFNCIYCECGLNEDSIFEDKLPSRNEVYTALEKHLHQMQGTCDMLDAITFSGNGEPTMHPDFEEIVNDTIVLRNRYSPDAKVCVLSNATQIRKESVYKALNRVDCNILKMDSASNEMIQFINQPNNPDFKIESLVEDLKTFNGNLTIQTIFLTGHYQGNFIDNTREEELILWLNALKRINPKQVMIYTLDRVTPVKDLEKIPIEKLEQIAAKVKALGIATRLSMHRKL